MRDGVQQLFRVLLAVLIPLASFTTGLGARIGAKHLWLAARRRTRRRQPRLAVA